MKNQETLKSQEKIQSIGTNSDDSDVGIIKRY